LVLLGAGPSQPVYTPPVLKDVGIEQKLGTQVPGNLVFTDEQGREVRLSDFYSKRPLILALVYYKCPMLCTMVLNDLARAMNSMRMSCGDDFDILTVSFDPHETPDLAIQKKQHYLLAYQRPHAAAGWHFLTGSQPMIQKLTDAAGFRYKWDPQYQQFAHASGIIILSPQGKITRYFFGIDYAPSDLELSLAEASGGKETSVADQILLYCFHYDPSTGRYSLMINRIVQAAGIATVLILGLGITLMLRRERRDAATRIQ
jgi:protein SCO1/2